MRFFDFLFPLRSDERLVRDSKTDTFLANMMPSLVPDTRPSTVALFPFHIPVVRAAIHEAKYHGNARAFTLLGEALVEYVRGTDTLESREVCLIPVPLGKSRRQERGFNQVEETLRNALRVLDPKIFTIDASILIRVKETPTQVSLPRLQREQNMQGAFMSTRPADPARMYYLVDDVITTGETLQSAINALKDAGAKYIIPLALAH